MHAKDSAPWWRSAVIYQIYIRSFADLNGDGVGDIAGIRSRLPYLRALGVDAIWITPWYPSPMVDAGYDVADYTGIDPVFGTVEDGEALISEAHDHGLRVVLDIVPNHTSDRHAWFEAALAAGPGSPERDRYIFRTGKGAAGGELPPNDWVGMFGGSAWTRVPDGEWYLHLFAEAQPDLNWENPGVRQDFEKVLAFWFDRGVDGFRIDVAHGLIKQEGLPDVGEIGDVLEPTKREDHPHWDRDGVHEIFREWRKVADRYDGDRTFTAEAWVSGPKRLARYVRPGELQTAFNFDYLRAPWEAARLREVIDASLEALGAVGAPATWVLSNHDVVRHVTRYGRTNTEGSGPRTDTTEPVDLALGTRRARAAALLMLALPGGAYVYQGEELGLAEVEDIPEEFLQDPVWERSGHTTRGRDGCRVPLPWSGDAPPFGFSPDGVTTWLPQPESWKELTAETQAGDPGSMLELYRAALRLRHGHPALGEGDLRWHETPEGVLVFSRTPGFTCAVNLSGEPYPLPAHAGVLLASGPLDGDTLPDDTAVWLAVEG
ncbi:glycoside hydrolase family 13 protein [Actinoallomurus bryophytorum]|uniref:Alpha-glucosidase n=1 Tax=Actinoallomurus bryophytorum TaxID=1490222 RepID=A0A543CWI7_9ACTN|nr:glycoside hydrolase family 13 protein [Actinoallomurus bryophytorum]TQM01466.1 alpha-glucosidase [Actinoallomurus bryophytorum]